MLISINRESGVLSNLRTIVELNGFIQVLKLIEGSSPWFERNQPSNVDIFVSARRYFEAIGLELKRTRIESFFSSRFSVNQNMLVIYKTRSSNYKILGSKFEI